MLAFLPIMAANIIFAKRFESSAHPATAFATNLLGAMVGGCLEYAALATGYRWLLIICALLYLARVPDHAPRVGSQPAVRASTR